ncbi:MAG: tRNA lysidine(34) synthetase TilS, partial [Nitrospira sp.]|nr:tRNA lysidine(34) synthetase TilS [Nitrospira sp.]
HTADDQTETFLMRLLRGSGSSGLSGIPPLRDRIIRPLIEITREEVNEFLSERGIRYRIDSSNLTTVYLRNKIRIELIPYLSREFNPNIMETLNRNLKILRDEDIFLDNYVKNIYNGLSVSKYGEDRKGSVRFDVAGLRSQPVPVKRRIIRYAVETIAGEGVVDLSFKHVEDSLSLLANEHGGEVHLPSGIIVKKDKVSFRVYLKAGETQLLPYSYNVAIPGTIAIPEAGIMVSALILDKEGYKSAEGFDEKYEACFPIEDIPGSLIVRNRRSGDLFYPKGMNGHRKKIKEYFIDMKISGEERDRIPILASPEGIMWVVGFRTDERFKVNSATEKILHVRAFRNAA